MESIMNTKTMALFLLVAVVSGGLGSLITIKLSTSPGIDFEQGIPELANPEKPVVDGKAMSQKEFIKEYCNNARAEFSMTCIAVRKSLMKNWSMMGDIPKAWKK